jgi:hypothetical protein
MANPFPPPVSPINMVTNADIPPNDDDISVNTVEARNSIIVNAGERQEYVIKFLFRPSDDSNNSEVARTHFTILKTINDIYPDETTIFDNYGATMKEFPTPKSYDQYLRHFKLQYVKGNQGKNRNPIYLAFHRLHSTIPISEIRKHHVIAALLQKVNTRLTTHHWLEDETRISTLGFFVGVDPGNYLKEDYQEFIRSKIATATKRSKKNVPKFQCGFTSPFIMSDGHRTSTKSYDIQCRQKDAKELIKLLHITYQSAPGFVFHKLRHVDAQTYTNAIRIQNSYLSKSRVVPIHGINSDIMFTLENEILQVDGVLGILRHKDTDTKGRWSIMTNESHFKPICAEFKEHLHNWVLFYSEQFPNPLTFPPPGLAFRNQQEDDDSGISFNTYMTNASSIYTVQEDVFDLPPARSNPAPQAWGGDPIPALLDSTVSTPANSGISTEEYDTVKRDNERLKRELATLTSRFDQYLNSQTPPPPAHNNFPPSFDMKEFIAATTQAVLQSVAEAQLQRGQIPPAIHAQPQSPSRRDQSLDTSMDEDLTHNSIH